MTTPIPQFSPDGSAFAFTPVPIARARHDGWSPERQRRFIAALARLGCVNAAARALGSSRTSAYKLRSRPGAESFAAAWDAALGTARAERFEALLNAPRSACWCRASIAASSSARGISTTTPPAWPRSATLPCRRKRLQR